VLKAFDEKDSKGRRKKEDANGNANLFAVDCERIVESKAYRRLSEKTQAFSLPEHPHIRTRSTHTDEVWAISRKISRALGINTELAEAIARGHDIGHAPFGHLGERMLTELGSTPATANQFKHAAYGVVLAQEIENRGRGMNLCYETLEGILYHARGSGELKLSAKKPAEYGVVMLADKIAYTFGDYSDSNRCDHFPVEKYAKLMEKINTHLGSETKERRDACVAALIKESRSKGAVSFSEGKEYELFKELREVLYSDVYKRIKVDMHKTAIKELYDFLASNHEFKHRYNSFSPVIFISLLTDREVTYFGQLLFSSKNIKLKDIEHFGAFELLPELKDKKVDYSNPGLVW